jgi:hypothetical protein
MQSGHCFATKLLPELSVNRQQGWQPCLFSASGSVTKIKVPGVFALIVAVK